MNISSIGSLRKSIDIYEYESTELVNTSLNLDLKLLDRNQLVNLVKSPLFHHKKEFYKKSLMTLSFIKKQSKIYGHLYCCQNFNQI